MDHRTGRTKFYMNVDDEIVLRTSDEYCLYVDSYKHGDGAKL
jgi:hypothetical protein